jgi:hypothetical protein
VQQGWADHSLLSQVAEIMPTMEQGFDFMNDQLQKIKSLNEIAPVKVENVNLPPAVAQMKQPTVEDNSNEGWTRWTLRMMRVI